MGPGFCERLRNDLLNQKNYATVGPPKIWVIPCTTRGCRFESGWEARFNSGTSDDQNLGEDEPHGRWRCSAAITARMPKIGLACCLLPHAVTTSGFWRCASHTTPPQSLSTKQHFLRPSAHRPRRCGTFFAVTQWPAAPRTQARYGHGHVHGTTKRRSRS